MKLYMLLGTLKVLKIEVSSTHQVETVSLQLTMMQNGEHAHLLPDHSQVVYVLGKLFGFLENQETGDNF